jgi:AraC family transcriptional regulator, glycine betaine-responsive activator
MAPATIAAPAFALTRKQAEINRELERIKDADRPKTHSLPREIATVLDFIHAHLFDPALNVNAVRQGCRLRNNNISTRFRAAVGLGIREYIEALRLTAASRLIRCCNFEIYLIGMAVGYSHQETFCRAYHRHFGEPPSGSRTGC